MERAKPIFGTAAAILAVVAILGPIVAFLVVANTAQPQGAQGWEGLIAVLLALGAALLVAAVASAGGLLAGLVALFRRERLRGLALAGLIGCGAILAFLSYLYVVTQMHP